MLFNRNFADLITFTRASTRMRFSSGGVLVQDAANVPSLDYDPITLAARGLLVEEPRTNLLWPSMYGAGVAPTYYTVTNANSWVPGQQAKKFVMVGVGGPNTPATNGSQFTATGAMCTWAIVEADPGSAAGAVTRLLFYKTSGTQGIWGGVNLDLTTGVATLSSGSGTVTYGVTKLSNSGPNGGAVYLIWTATTNAGGETLNAFPYAITDGTASGAGKSVIVHHHQMEAGAYPSSVIVTTSAQATRAADSAAITDLTKIGFNASEGTLYAELPVPVSVSSLAAGILSLHDGTSLNRIVAWIGSGSFRVLSTVAGAAQTYSAGVAPAVGTLCKFAFAYRANDFASSLNGAAAVTGTLLGVPAVNALRLGATTPAASSEVLGGQIRSVRYYPRRMTNAELQSLTT